MKKRILAALTCAAMLTMGTAALAVDETVEPIANDIAATESVAIASVLSDYATVISNDGALIIKTKNDGTELQLNMAEDTVIVDTQSGLPVSKTLAAGDSIFVYYSAAMTRSIPAQASCYAIMTNLDENHVPAHLLTVQGVQQNGSTGDAYDLYVENGGMIVTVLDSNPISSLRTKEIVKAQDLHVGMRILAWYDVATMSYPGGALADRVVVLPQANRDVTVKAGDKELTGRMENGVLMVPLRATAEAVGFTVTWNETDWAVEMTDGKMKTVVSLGQDTYYGATAIEGATGMTAPISFGAPAYEVDGTSWIPAELFTLLSHPVSMQGENTVLIG